MQKIVTVNVALKLNAKNCITSFSKITYVDSFWDYLIKWCKKHVHKTYTTEQLPFLYGMCTSRTILASYLKSF